MMKTRILTVSVAGALCALAAARAPAQLAGKFVLTPYVGAYVPTNDLLRFSGATALTSAAASARHQAAPAIGTTGSYWITDRMGLEGGVVYSSSDLKGGATINEAGAVTSFPGKDHANVWLVTTKLMLQLLPPESDYNLRLGFGPALITRNGTAYNTDASGGFTGLTDIGAVVSLCSRLNLTENFALRLRAEDYLYQANIGLKDTPIAGQTFSLGERRQNDLVFSLGFQMFLNR